MGAGDAKSISALGFLTVVRHPEHGLFGGYLLLNRSGRPLEFHCTAPIKPNRAQEILYGPTLEPYLFGEQIGRTLAAKSGVEPLVICTDCEPALAVREHVEMPVVLVLPETAEVEPAPSSPVYRVDAAHAAGSRVMRFALGRNRLAVSAMAVADRAAVTERLGELAESFDLSEPFQRIREAIEEARRGSA
jgi:hypothetical protein